MFDLIFALALAGSTDVTSNELATAMPADFSTLEMAKFRKRLTYGEQHERKAERLAKAANCELPVVSDWVFAKIHAAILVSAEGEILKIVPVDSGCPELEQYTVNHIARYGSDIAPIPPGHEPKWYRTTMNYRWPE
jgi:hypothetical protein